MSRRQRRKGRPPLRPEALLQREDLGDRIAESRTRAGLTQDRLAEVTGLANRQAVSVVERGLAPCPPSLAEWLAAQEEGQ